MMRLEASASLSTLTEIQFPPLIVKRFCITCFILSLRCSRCKEHLLHRSLYSKRTLNCAHHQLTPGSRRFYRRRCYPAGMNTQAIVADIDAQIAKLQEAKAVLIGLDSVPVKSKVGRPKKRKKMSAEARARIAAAQKKRWAATKKRAKAATAVDQKNGLA